MSRWNSPVYAYEFGRVRTIRTDGEVWQVQDNKSIDMTDGKLASFQEDIDRAIEGMEDVEIRFRKETDHHPAEIHVTGWRAMREDEESFIPE